MIPIKRVTLRGAYRQSVMAAVYVSIRHMDDYMRTIPELTAEGYQYTIEWEDGTKHLSHSKAPHGVRSARAMG